MSSARLNPAHAHPTASRQSAPLHAGPQLRGPESKSETETDSDRDRETGRESVCEREANRETSKERERGRARGREGDGPGGGYVLVSASMFFPSVLCRSVALPPPLCCTCTPLTRQHTSNNPSPSGDADLGREGRLVRRVGAEGLALGGGAPVREARDGWDRRVALAEGRGLLRGERAEVLVLRGGRGARGAAPAGEAAQGGAPALGALARGAHARAAARVHAVRGVEARLVVHRQRRHAL
eukprot:2378076-Rhodomonas_salina.1